MELSFLNEDFTFIGREDFYTDTAQKYLELQKPIDPFGSLRYNQIKNKECVVCFVYDEEIEFFLENKYEFVNIIHNSCRSLTKLPKNEKNTIQLIFHENFFEMVVVSDHFEYYNCFNYASELDVVYAVKHFVMGKDIEYSIAIFGKPKKGNIKSILEKQTKLRVFRIKNTDYYTLLS